MSDKRFINSDKPVLGTEEDTLKDVRFLQGSTEFSYALENGYNDLVLVLLDAMNDDAGYAPGDKQRIAGEMLFAALKYHSQKREEFIGASTWMIIQRLLNQGADINYNKGYQHDTPLYELLLHPEDEDTFSKSLLLKFLDCKGMENGELTVPVRVDNQCIGELGKIFVRLIPEDLRNQTKARVESPQDSTYLKG
ncbi:hypothetical protein [Legionella drozanskii]|uniref:hypothetical protein n=1 Tax=Legionella drozanskii TaxID=96228 RepID=UPI0010419599|nr:hypothetical protein [Legionella drozanskii]